MANRSETMSSTHDAVTSDSIKLWGAKAKAKKKIATTRKSNAINSKTILFVTKEII